VSQYNQLLSSLEEYIRKIYNEWIEGVEKDLMSRLDIPLMTRTDDKFLESNFDIVLQR
jgi:hypothetical protein